MRPLLKIDPQKKQFLLAIEAPLYFWRDQKGHEVDLLSDLGAHLLPLEVKSGATFNPEFIDGLDYFNQLQQTPGLGELVYGGDTSHNFRNYKIRSWKEI